MSALVIAYAVPSSAKLASSPYVLPLLCAVIGTDSVLTSGPVPEAVLIVKVHCSVVFVSPSQSPVMPP